MSLVLENALKNYTVFVNGQEFSCEFLESIPELLECIGPDVDPGERVVIEIYQNGEGGELVKALAGTIPDYPPDTSDTDQDGVPDTGEDCPLDPEKISPGECGCGVPDIDSDGDGVPDCEEACQDGRSDQVGNPCNHDEDGDGADDFVDRCPLDPDKTKPGACGCGEKDTDTDKDGTPDCEDKCPEDPEKIKPGECGCGDPDTDQDEDDVVDCEDACPSEWGPKSNDGCPEETDTDEDGVPDYEDECPEQAGPASNEGCPIKDIDDDDISDFEEASPEE
jgi:hypothetical protein